MNCELELAATSLQEISPVLLILTGAIVGSRGWVLSPTLSEDDAEISFEFERRLRNRHTALVTAGLSHDSTCD